MVKAIYDAFDRGDIDSVLARLDQHVEWNEAEHVTLWPGAPFAGPDAVVAGRFARIPATFGRTWKLHIDRLYNCDDTVIMQGRYRGTARATGTDLAPQFVHIWDLDDAKVIRFQQYTDTWLFAEATGIPPVVTVIP